MGTFKNIGKCSDILAFRFGYNQIKDQTNLKREHSKHIVYTIQRYYDLLTRLH